MPQSRLLLKQPTWGQSASLNLASGSGSRITARTPGAHRQRCWFEATCAPASSVCLWRKTRVAHVGLVGFALEVFRLPEISLSLTIKPSAHPHPAPVLARSSRCPASDDLHGLTGGTVKNHKATEGRAAARHLAKASRQVRNARRHVNAPVHPTARVGHTLRPRRFDCPSARSRWPSGALAITKFEKRNTKQAFFSQTDTAIWSTTAQQGRV